MKCLLIFLNLIFQVFSSPAFPSSASSTFLPTGRKISIKPSTRTSSLSFASPAIPTTTAKDAPSCAGRETISSATTLARQTVQWSACKDGKEIIARHVSLQQNLNYLNQLNAKPDGKNAWKKNVWSADVKTFAQDKSRSW